MAKPEPTRLNGKRSNQRRAQLGSPKRIVVKIGSGVIAAGGKLRPKRIADIAHDVTVLRHQGYEVVMVVSGAVAAGYPALGLAKPPTAVVERQAAASIGQYKLMMTFARAFAKHRVDVAQILMMLEDMENRRRFLSARHTLQSLIARGVVPVINENDPLADDEAKIGDNDHLGALVTNVASAQLLVILSSVPGILRAAGNGAVISRVEVGSSVDEHITSDTTATGVGGMVAKVSAARLASAWGVPTVIADGKEPGLLPRILAGEEIGTVFLPREGNVSSRKRWIAFRTKSDGAIVVDNGAKTAVVDRGASLLPAGVIDVQGQFAMGARVDLLDEGGGTFAVGLVSYNANEIRLMKGRKRGEFLGVLGYRYVDEIIARDDLVLTGQREASRVYA